MFYIIVEGGDSFQLVNLCVWGKLLPEAHSAFHTELVALDCSVDVLVSVLGKANNV